MTQVPIFKIKCRFFYLLLSKNSQIKVNKIYSHEKFKKYYYNISF